MVELKAVPPGDFEAAPFRAECGWPGEPNHIDE